MCQPGRLSDQVILLCRIYKWNMDIEFALSNQTNSNENIKKEYSENDHPTKMLNECVHRTAL